MVHTSLYYDSTYSTSLLDSSHYSTMALLHSTLLYLPWLYFTLLDSTLLLWLYLGLLHSTLLYHGSTTIYLTLHYSTMVLLHSTWTLLLCPLLDSTRLYTLLDSLPWLYFTLLRLYITLPWLYFTLLDSLHYSTMALLHSTRLYIHSTMALFYFTLLWLYIHSTKALSSVYIRLYITLPLLHVYLTQNYSTKLYLTLLVLYIKFYHGSTSLY